MVSTASAAAQASEVEKKRKQTLERAKANHLSRQLQMRLQYARLKVEHGWQRQNLNEVENLYFHHSHQRGPKSFTPSSAFTPSQTDHHMSIISSLRYSDPLYKSWLQSQSRSSTLDTLPDNPTQEKSSTSENPSLPFIPAVPQLVPDGSNNTSRISSTAHSPVDIQISHPPPNPSTPTQTPAPESQIASSQQDGKHNPGTPGPSRTSSLTPHTSASTPVPENTPSLTSAVLGTSQSSTIVATSFVPTITPTPKKLSKIKAASFGNKSNTPSKTKDMFGSNTTSLTYDSFWSGLQSKSYPALKGGAQTTATTASALNNAPITTIEGFPTSKTTVSSFAPVSAKPAPSITTAQKLTSTPTSTSTSSPPMPSQPQLSTTTPSSLSSTSGPSTTIPASMHSTMPTSFSTVPVPISTPLPVPHSYPIPPHIQTSMSNRYLSDNTIPWHITPSSTQPQQQQTQGASITQHHFLQTSFLTNPGAFPFLANLSASYAQAFGIAARGPGSAPSSVGVSVADGSVEQTATSTGAVPPSNGPMSPSSPHVVSALVGQQDS